MGRSLYGSEKTVPRSTKSGLHTSTLHDSGALWSQWGVRPMEIQSMQVRTSFHHPPKDRCDPAPNSCNDQRFTSCRRGKRWRFVDGRYGRSFAKAKRIKGSLRAENDE